MATSMVPFWRSFEQLSNGNGFYYDFHIGWKWNIEKHIVSFLFFATVITIYSWSISFNCWCLLRWCLLRWCLLRWCLLLCLLSRFWKKAAEVITSIRTFPLTYHSSHSFTNKQQMCHLAPGFLSSIVFKLTHNLWALNLTNCFLCPLVWPLGSQLIDQLIMTGLSQLNWILGGDEHTNGQTISHIHLYIWQDRGPFWAFAPKKRSIKVCFSCSYLCQMKNIWLLHLHNVHSCYCPSRNIDSQKR